MKLWRIATETRTYPANDLSGAGAAKNPGRWNNDGQAVVYCAPTLAMAVLETAAHINTNGLPLNRFVVCIDVPDSIWAKRRVVTTSKLPATWRAIPAGMTSVSLGSKWWIKNESAVLQVPSAIVPEESVCLLNSHHVDHAKVSIKVVRAFDFDVLFRA